MSAQDPHGGQKFAFLGLPYAGVKRSSAAFGAQKFGFNGLPASPLIPLLTNITASGAETAGAAIDHSTAFLPITATGAETTASDTDAGTVIVRPNITASGADTAKPATETGLFLEAENVTENVLGGTTSYVFAALDPNAPIGGLIASIIGGVVAGSVPPPVTLTPGQAGNGAAAVIEASPYDAWYFRLWLFPSILTPVNPRFSFNLPFDIFNAFPTAATLSSITGMGSGNAAISFDTTTGDVIAGYQDRTINAQILPSAPPKIDAVFTFAYDKGSPTLAIKATIADFLVMFADEGAIETLSWLTNVMKSWDGSEQRVALRSQPRRALQFNIILDTDERKRQYTRYFKFMGRGMIVPLYWYSARINQADTAGATRIFFDPTKTDVRNGEFIVIADPSTYSGQLCQIDTVQSDGATIVGTLQQDITTNMLVAPGLSMRLIDSTGLVMNSVSGTLAVNVEATGPRVTSFTRPGASPTFTLFNSLPVLERQPVAEQDSPESFIAGYDILQYDTGAQLLDVTWKRTEVSGERMFRIHRERLAGEMDYWRGFLDLIKGEQGTFYMQTWLPDLTLVSTPALGSASLNVVESDYATSYFPFASYQQLAIYTANGTIYRTVQGVTVNGDGTVTIALLTNLGSNPGDNIISQISFLNLCRFDSDDFTFTHQMVYSNLQCTIRTVDE